MRQVNCDLRIKILELLVYFVLQKEREIELFFLLIHRLGLKNLQASLGPHSNEHFPEGQYENFVMWRQQDYEFLIVFAVFL